MPVQYHVSVISKSFNGMNGRGSTGNHPSYSMNGAGMIQNELSVDRETEYACTHIVSVRLSLYTGISMLTCGRFESTILFGAAGMAE